MEEVIERVLQQLGKSQSEFDAEVEEARQQSNPEMMAQLIALMMMNAEATATMLSIVIAENTDLKARIIALEGGQPV